MFQATLTAKVNGKDVSTVVYASEVEKTTGQILHRLTTRAVIRDWEDGNLSENKIDSDVQLFFVLFYSELIPNSCLF